MPTTVGPNTKGEENLVFGYDLGDVSNSYKGEPTTNYITTMAATLGGNVSLSYPENVYICTALETNVTDPTAPGGQYSRFTGNTDSENNQLFTTFVNGGINARSTTVTYSVYLKGSGTCHLTLYDDISGYGTSPTITLTPQWTRYSYTKTLSNYTTYGWPAVRGVLTSTNVYVAAQQAEFKSHSTPFVNGTRSATQGLLDLKGNSTIDLSNVSFDSNAQMTFDGTNDTASTTTNITLGSNFSMEAVVYRDTSATGDIISSWNNPYRFLWRITSGNVQEFAWNGGGGSNTVTGTGTVSTGVYRHIIVTYDGVNVKFYTNGTLTDTFAKSFSLSNITAMQVGSNTYDSVYFDGRIPFSKIYSRTLTASEISANYKAIKGRFNI